MCLSVGLFVCVDMLLGAQGDRKSIITSGTEVTDSCSVTMWMLVTEQEHQDLFNC